MKTSWRTSLLSVVLIVLGLLQSHCGAAGSLSGSAATGSDDASSGDGQLFQGGPVEIPVGIANNSTGGVDATSVYLTGNSAQNQSAALLRTPTDGFGTVNFRLQNATADRLVALIGNGEIITTTTTVSGAGTFDLGSEFVGVPLAILVGEEGTTVDEGDWSPPVIVTPYIDSTGLVDESNFITVGITNTAATASGSMGAADLQLSIAMASADEITFTAIDGSDEPFIGKIGVAGSQDYSLFAEGDAVGNGLMEISYDGRGILTGMDTGDGSLYRIDATGTLSYHESSPLLPNDPEHRHYRISPDGEWLAANRLTSSGSLSQSIALISLDDTANENLITIQNAFTFNTESRLFFEWLSDTRMMGFYLASPPTGAQAIDVTNALTGDATVTASTLFDSYGNFPQYITSRNTIVFACFRGESRSTDLCAYDLDSQTLTTLVELTGDDSVVLLKVSPGENYVTYEIDLDENVSEINPIAVYDLTLGEQYVFGKGGSPTPAPDNYNIIGYLTCDNSGDQICDSEDVGGMQIGILNLENFGLDYN